MTVIRHLFRLQTGTCQHSRSNFHNNQSHLLVGNHGGIKVRKAGKDAADNLLHGLAGDALQQLPLGPSLLHDAEAGADDRADVAVGQRGDRKSVV